MAAKTISELIAASSINAADLFAIVQTGITKKATGTVLLGFTDTSAKLAISASSPLVYSNTTGVFSLPSTNTTQLGYLSGVTSAIQTQFTNIHAGKSIVSVSSNVTLTDQAIHLVDTSSSRTLTLPSPAATSYIVVKDITGSAATNAVGIAPHGSEKIENVAATYYLAMNLGSYEFVSNGTDWFILGNCLREYAYNSSNTNANDTTSFGYGTAGAQFVNVTAQRLKTVAFKNTITPQSIISIEVTEDGGNTWIPNGQWGGITSYMNFNSTGIGMSWIHNSSTSIIVGFEASRIPGTNYALGIDWSGIAASSTYKWRIVKIN